jgi:hypothetical protein
MSWFRRHYGAGPWQLLGVLVCFAIAAYAVTRVFGQGGWKAILAWFVICVLLHDLIGWPAYALADRVLLRVARRSGDRAAPVVPWINHVRAPTIISGLLLIMFAPLIFRLSNGYYEALTGFNENVYLTNWLLVTALLFGGSAVIYLVRLLLALRTARQTG